MNLRIITLILLGAASAYGCNNDAPWTVTKIEENHYRGVQVRYPHKKLGWGNYYIYVKKLQDGSYDGWDRNDYCDGTDRPISTITAEKHFQLFEKIYKKNNK